MEKVTILTGGLYKPADQFNPRDAVGRCSTLHNWVCHDGVYSLIEGITGPLNGSHLSANCIFTWINNSGVTSVGYVHDQDLRGITSGVDSSLFSTLVAADTDNRYCVEKFRLYHLIGTTAHGLKWFRPSWIGGANPVAGSAGVTAPSTATVAAVGTATGLTGVYKGVYTYVNIHGHESNPSSANAGVTVSDEKINWTITVGGSDIVARKFYRTVANGSLYLYHSTISDNTTTAITGDSTADTSLGAEVEIDNTVPPTAVWGICPIGQRLWLIDGSDGLTLRACKIDYDTGEPNWEAYPSKLSAQIPAGGTNDMVYSIFNINDVLYAATRERLYTVSGDPSSGSTVTKVAGFGVWSPFSWCYVDKSVCLLTNTKKVLLLSPDGSITDLGLEIQSLLSSEITGTNTPIYTGYEHADLCYRADKNQIVLNFYKTPSTSNDRTYIYDIPSKQWSEGDLAMSMTAYDGVNQRIYAVSAQAGINYYPYTDYRTKASYYTDQRIETYPYILSLSDPIWVGRIGLVVEAKPIRSFVPPILKVGFALDNTNIYVDKFVDISKTYLPSLAGGIGDAGIVKRMVYVPVFKACNSIAVRVYPAANAASVQYGATIYDIFIEVEKAAAVPQTKNRSSDIFQLSS